MPTRNPRPCPAFPCPHLRPCPIHDRRTTNPRLEHLRNERRKKSLEVYRSARWRRLRKKILLERPFCQTRGCHQPATDVDHVLPIEDGGDPWDETNLAALCHPDHSRKTARDVARRGARARGATEGKGRANREEVAQRTAGGSRAHIAGGRELEVRDLLGSDERPTRRRRRSS